MHFTPGRLQIAILSLLFVVVDFFSKSFFETHSFIISKFLTIKFFRQYEHINFSTFLNSHSLILSILSYFISLIIMGFFFTKYYNRTILFSIGLISAGIIGNLIDKILFGFTKTFIDFHHPSILIFLDSEHIPSFNLAYVFIVIGSVIFTLNKKW